MDSRWRQRYRRIYTAPSYYRRTPTLRRNRLQALGSSTLGGPTAILAKPYRIVPATILARFPDKDIVVLYNATFRISGAHSSDDLVYLEVIQRLPSNSCLTVCGTGTLYSPRTSDWLTFLCAESCLPSLLWNILTISYLVRTLNISLLHGYLVSRR